MYCAWLKEIRRTNDREPQTAKHECETRGTNDGELRTNNAEVDTSQPWATEMKNERFVTMKFENSSKVHERVYYNV